MGRNIPGWHKAGYTGAKRGFRMRGPASENHSSVPSVASVPSSAGHSHTFRSLSLQNLYSTPFWWGICLLSAAILAFADRQFLNPDGLSYVEIASSALHRGPGEFLNGYWSPFYPLLLAVALLFRPALRYEVQLLHLVNFLIFVATLWTFHFFLHGWIAYAEQFDPAGEQQKKAILPFGYCLLLWFTLKNIGLGNITPDLAVAAVIFLVAGLICRLSVPGTGLKPGIALGLVLALGYYTKAVMLPLELALLVWLFLFPPSQFANAFRRKLLLSLSIFLLAVGPLIAALSHRVGHLTYGETGRLNYAWFVNGVPKYIGWTGGTVGGEGFAEHAPRKLMEHPLILEFDSPVKGSFPLWYEPSYWYAGLKVHFDLHEQISALQTTFAEYKVMFSQMAVFFSGAFVLGWMGAWEKSHLKTAWRMSWLLIWPLAAVGLYALVHVETRFLGAYFVLGWLTIYVSLSQRSNPRVASAICATVAGTVVVLFLGYLGVEAAGAVRDLVQARQPDYQLVASGLRNLGLRDGDRVAIVGHDPFPLYARYAGVRVVAEIVSADEFWKLSPDELQSVRQHLKQIGVKAVVASNKPASITVSKWKDVKTSGPYHFNLLLLDDRPTIGLP
jgi:hypothetical protein